MAESGDQGTIISIWGLLSCIYGTVVGVRHMGWMYVLAIYGEVSK
jgi:hypothetical protein